MAIDLTAVLRLKDDFTSKMKKAADETSKLKKVTEKIEKPMKKLDKAFMATGAAAAAGFATVGTAALKAGAQGEEAQKMIAAGTGATGEALDDLMESYRNIGKQVPEDLNTVAQAMANMNTYSGATGDTLEGMTKRVIDASRMMGEDVVANVDSFGKAMNQWQIPAADAEETVAKLFSVAQDTGIGFGELSGQLSNYGAVLKNVGFSIDESAQLFGKLENSGISVSRIMPGLNSAFRRWAGEGKNVQDELGGVIERMQSAGSSTEALSIATDAFGAEGAARLTSAVRNGVFSLEDLSGGLDGAMESMDQANADAMTFSEKMSQVGNNVSVALEPLGMAILDVAGEYMPQLEESAGNMASYISENMPQIKEAFSGFAETATNVITTVTEKAQTFASFISDNWSTIKPLLIGLAGVFVTLRATMAAMTIISTISKLWTAFRGVITSVRTAQLLLNGAMLANPIGLIIGLIVGLIAAGVWLYKNWDTVKEKLGQLWSFIKDVWGKLVDWTKRTFSNIWKPIRETWDNVWNKTKEIWNNVKTSIGEAMDSAKEKVTEFFSPLLNFIDTAKGAWDNLVGALKNFSLPEAVSNIASGVGNFVGGLIPGAYHGEDYVPRDNMLYRLHKGEMVLPRQEAEVYRNFGGNVGVTPSPIVVQQQAQGEGRGDVYVTITGNDFHVRDETDIKAVGDALADRIESRLNRGTF